MKFQILNKMDDPLSGFIGSEEITPTVIEIFKKNVGGPYTMEITTFFDIIEIKIKSKLKGVSLLLLAVPTKV